MDLAKKYFPFAFQATELKSFLTALIVFILVDVICGLVIGFLASIPVIGIIFSIIGTVVGLYALIGIVLSVLVFLKVIG